jgi:hypothetical protein
MVLARTAVTVAMLAVLWPPPAGANPVKSQYTTIDLGTCKKTRRHANGDAWLCAGLRGYPVHVAEGDLHTFVSIGSHAETHRAASQTLGSFNTIFASGARRTTLEWRFDRRQGRLVPYAVILRYFTQKDGSRGEVLVVTKVTPQQSCHVAHIDALATPEPMVLAHKIADETARAFDCSSAPLTAGKSPM